MREMEFKELLDIQLNILKQVDHFCRANEIEYFMYGGTGIGAIRHKGYIPWDDDIDIAMTRPNYDRFINSFNGSCENLEVFAPELNWSYYAPYANVCDKRTLLDEGVNGHNGQEIGVKIDIFQIDGAPDSDEEYQNMWKTNRYFMKSMFVRKEKLSVIWKESKIRFFKHIIKKLVYCIFSFEYMQKKTHKIATKYQFGTTSKATNLTYPYPKLTMCERSWFEHYIDVDFEDMKARMIADYDPYLRVIFGDYMQLPPENQRIAHHGFKAYWKD